MRNNVYRQGKVHVKREMCETCVFRPGNLLDLRPGRLRELIDQNLAVDAALPCHDTLGTRKRAVCRGFFGRFKHDSATLRMAVILHCIEEQN